MDGTFTLQLSAGGSIQQNLDRTEGAPEEAVRRFDAESHSVTTVHLLHVDDARPAE